MHSNFLNNGNSEEEFTKMKLEYDNKIKPYNSSPEYISIISIFPKDIKTLSILSIPMSIALSPMKNTGEDLPLINYNENNMPRCPNRNCNAYMNPFIKFIKGGEKWLCNLCGQINDTEEFYYSDVDKNGIRLDVNDKQELCCGFYEVITNKSYWKKGKDPTEAFSIFVFVTLIGAIKNGFSTASMESVKEAINNKIFYKGEKIKISIMTYSSAIDFYSYNEKFIQP